MQIFYKKKIEGENKVTRDLFSSIIEKVNWYKMIKHSLARKEQIEFKPIDIIYEPIYDANVPEPCYYTDQIHLAYRSYIGTNIKGKEKILRQTVRQCPYCENFFVRNNETMKKHTQVCAAKEGITYCFNNGEIMSFQDTFSTWVMFPLQYILISKQPQVILIFLFFLTQIFLL